LKNIPMMFASLCKTRSAAHKLNVSERTSKTNRKQGLSIESVSSFYAISSGWNTSSNLSAVRKPNSTQASLREMLSLYAFLAVFAAFS